MVLPSIYKVSEVTSLVLTFPRSLKRAAFRCSAGIWCFSVLSFVVLGFKAVQFDGHVWVSACELTSKRGP